jgi:hypothetical protein
MWYSEKVWIGLACFGVLVFLYIIIASIDASRAL